MKVTIRTKKKSYEISCDHGERILYAALHNKVPVPYECATGTCGTCRARVKSGRLKELWQQAPGKSSIKPERSEFLMCQCSADSDLEILVPGNLADEMLHRVPATHHGVITQIQQLTHDVIGFIVNLENTTLSFDPGQFVVLKIPELSGYRAYSMVNHGKDLSQLEFVIKRKFDGGFSDRIFSGSLDAVPIECFGPLGQATLRDDDSQNLVCLAGGSGIAGIMSILHAASENSYFSNNNCHGQVIFGVRCMNDLFYVDELSSFVEKNHGHLSVTIALSDQSPDSDTIGALQLAHGFVHEVAAHQMSVGDEHCIGFIAGPPPMVDASIRMLMTEAKFGVDRIRYDKFN